MCGMFTNWQPGLTGGNAETAQDHSVFWVLPIDWQPPSGRLGQENFQFVSSVFEFSLFSGSAPDCHT